MPAGSRMAGTMSSMGIITISKVHAVPSTILEQTDETRSVLVQHKGANTARPTTTATAT